MVFYDRIILCGGLIVLLMAVIAISSGQPMLADRDLGQMGNFELKPPNGAVMMPKVCDHSKGIPVELLIRSRGFALKENEKHTLRVNVERLMHLKPMDMRRLISSNKSIEEIRKDILTMGDDAIYDGNMRLDWRDYILINIVVNPSKDNITTMTADVVDPRTEVRGNTPVTIGQIAINIIPSNGYIIGNGDLRINSGQNIGSYTLLLDMAPPIKEKHMIN